MTATPGSGQAMTADEAMSGQCAPSCAAVTVFTSARVGVGVGVGVSVVLSIGGGDALSDGLAVELAVVHPATRSKPTRTGAVHAVVMAGQDCTVTLAMGHRWTTANVRTVAVGIGRARQVGTVRTSLG